jgi:hypothetical protein
VANCGTLSASVLQQLTQQGWLLIPTWVGPQAPCTGFSRRMSADPATAYQQGVIEAFLASDRAEKLGLTLPNQSGTIIYYDLEAYSNLNEACRAATQAFISGWSATLHARGSKAGVYGLCSNLAHFGGIPNVPDAVWLAAWNYPSYDPSASTTGLTCISDTLWSQGQRLRQYTGGHNETWGGVTFNIDSDVLAGPVATTGSSCVPGSGQAALFIHANYGGQCTVKGLGDYPTHDSLGGFWDQVSSIRVGPHVKVQLCQRQNFNLQDAVCQDFIASDPDLADDPIGDNTVSSMRVMGYSPVLNTRSWFSMFRMSPPVSVGLPNGHFENGPVDWSASSALGLNVIVPNNVLAAAGVTPHGGAWAVWMGGAHAETVTLQQVVGVPVEAPLLSYWHWIKSSEAGCYYDIASLWVNGSVMDSYGLCGDTGGWVQQVVDLSAYRGSVVDLRFLVTTDTSLTSSLFIDDVSWRSGP